MRPHTFYTKLDMPIEKERCANLCPKCDNLPVVVTPPFSMMNLEEKQKQLDFLIEQQCSMARLKNYILIEQMKK
eukprot:TRINITY_DN756_c0_g1_i1.p1 TRINITY_DN756_c0_g1~~TRINITY_DN756_c0_g1_i1.p1  ORF type:complete len:74 (-),score=21.47 TRINITY_DN756_c0_g1_i1:126-347(-)